MMNLLGFDGCRIAMDRIRTAAELATFVDGLRLEPPFIVKPNWINEEYAHLTDPLVLTWLLESLTAGGRTCVVEAYSARNQAMRIEEVPGESKADRYRRTEKRFLERQGLDRAFKNLSVSYVNVDEEVLSGRTVDPEVIRSATESRFGPIEREELYAFIPSKLYEMRHGTMISFAKFKLTFSMCTKNIFGLIPDLAQPHGRGFYHGKKDRMLPRSIIDINKIYRSVFQVVGMVEGVRSLTGPINRGPYHSMFGYDYEVYDGQGLLYFGDDPLWLDAFIAGQCGLDPMAHRTTVLPQPHLALGYQEVSPWPPQLEEAARSLGNPLPDPQR